MVDDCAVTHYSNPNVLRVWRESLLRRLHTQPRPEGGQLHLAEPDDPLEAYEILFAQRPDEHVRARVLRRMAARRASSRQLRRAHRRHDSKRGWIYVYWDSADAQNVFKIGFTTIAAGPAERVRNWERALVQPGEPRSLTMLFAFATRAPIYAEEMVHTLLRCEHMPNRVNPLTERDLTEYFRVHDFRSLGHLVNAVTRWIDWAVLEHVAH